MKDTEIFYFDLDGTILDNDHNTISDSTVKALKTLKNKGYKLAICTGRTIGSVQNTPMNDIVQWDGYVLSNGATVCDDNFNIIHSSVCKPDFIKSLIESYSDPILLETDELYLVNGINTHFKEFFELIGIEEPVQIEYDNQIVPKVTFEKINHFQDGAHNILFNDYTYHINNFGLYEFIPKDAGKENGMKVLNKHLNVKTTCFFGDGSNDIEAIQEATLGIAMGNALNEVKDVADYITSDVDDDGIYNALKHFNVI